MKMFWGAALAGFCIFAAPAWAQQAPASDDPFATVENLPLGALDGQTVVTDSATIASSVQNLSATNSGNSVEADSVTTGDIVLSADSFSGFSGIGNFVMNTGNNNNLQGTVSVVVVMPGP
jgi:hypothetical protein